LALPEYEKLAGLTRSSHSSTSAHLPVVEEKDAAGEVAALYDYFRSHFGRPDVPGILKCFATHPPLLRHMMELSESLLFADGHLSRRHKEMIATLVSSQNACAYCADSHGYFLRVHGGSSEALCALQQSNLTSPALTTEERALLGFAGKVNRQSNEITSTDVIALEEAGWSKPQIAEAVHIAALFATFNRVVNAFGLPSQGLLELLRDEAMTIQAKNSDYERSIQ
jgi:uncharacterized peroxidase-related enzyme